MSLSLKYMYAIDELREEQGITQADFSDGICNVRQYRRYLSGDSEVPQAKISQFCEKLGIRASDFYYKINAIDLTENNDMFRANELLNHGKFDDCKKIIDEYKDFTFMTIMGKRHYEFLLVEYGRKKGSIHKDSAYEKYKSMLHYDTIQKRKNYDFVDMNILMTIIEIEYDKDIDTGIDVLRNILQTREFIYVSSNTRSVLPTIYSEVLRYLSKKDRLEEVLELADEAISYSEHVRSYASLPHSLFYKGRALFKLDRKEEANYYFKRSFALFMGMDNLTAVKYFEDVYRDYYKLNIYELLKR